VAAKPTSLSSAPLSLKEIRDAIPPHLFDFDPVLSVYYIARDFVQLAVTAAAAWYVLGMTENAFLRIAIWAAYALIQGTTCFGLWVIAHECGHQAYFGRHSSINNAVGYVLHTALLVPFHNWRISHGTHHRYTNNREKDTAFPDFQKPMKFWPLLEYFPAAIVLNMLMFLTLGWLAYLFFNLEGARFAPKYQHINHFSPSSPYFKPSERHLIVVSNIGVLAVFAGLCAVAYQTSLAGVLLWYGSAWLVCHMWLVVVTLLQHSDDEAPHYDNEDWDFVRGALSTIDRNYGSIINNMLHHITDGHVVHHLFSTMPFYHAIQATPYVRKALGPCAKYDNRPLFLQMCHSFFTHQSSWQNNPIWLKQKSGFSCSPRKTSAAKKHSA
jgi:omega-6 fatty acid desaturase (delta-12 desaturase)